MDVKKKVNIETLILKLLGEKQEISIHNVALTAGLSINEPTDGPFREHSRI
jgi:hypothetical protein